MSNVPRLNGHAIYDHDHDHDQVNVDVKNAMSIVEVRAALLDLQKKEAVVTSQLDTLIASQKEIQRQLNRLDVFRTNLGTQAAKTRSVSNGLLSTTATTAKRISTSVKKLDTEQSRVKSTLTVVEQVRELRSCVLGLAGSMGAPQDWETAASYISKVSKLPDDVIDGDFACRVVPTAEVPDSPRITLEHASESLCVLFLREFEKAVRESDGSKITRFFKLFPLINRSEAGLDVYGKYVCQGVASRARTNLNAGTGNSESTNGFFFANALMKLFEHVAQIVDGHGALVERHYGNGKMTRVIERLQIEADLQGGIIVDSWSDDRRVDRHLTDIKSYPYTFLVQSFLPTLRNSTSTPRTSSPAPIRSSEDDVVDMRNIDGLLSEMTSMLGKWALYVRFVSEKCGSNVDQKDNKVPSFLVNSMLMNKIDEKVLSPFNAMTTFYFRRSIEKAFQLDEQPADLSLNPHKSLGSSPPYVTSAIEDIMYITNKVVQQSLATSQVKVIISVIPTLSRVMSSDFLGMEQRKMRDEHYPKAAVKGALPPEHTIVSFLVLINNLDVAKDYINQIVHAQLEGSEGQTLNTLFPSPGEAEIVANTLRAFTASFNEKTTEILNEGIRVVFENVVKPRLKSILLDSFRDTNYVTTIEQLRDMAADDTDAESLEDEVRRRFQHSWTALTKPIGRLMTEKTFDLLLTKAVEQLSRQLERRLWTYQGRVNQTGASRLERDINDIIKVVVTGQKYSFREAFLKCSQICMILNMDEEEWQEVQDNSGGADSIADKLRPDERLRARGMMQNGKTDHR